ncbi:hypothetical protein BSFA1_60220 (plasmid) [Burkholderia sp. SFA1]|uniref:hypothetical protein n=1 Tax=unclassified Caballeronia TaxID=2646786 RepID=UPI001F423D42|nr:MULTISPECIES: hypothetical protein [unclassified Caballeronia]MCE4547193.1 hypothetical protein [Caballeronia sp. PC1]MCE4572333.1 hypothetical protein [Caballeronia sp. CLC5]BBQ00894.1 hypothetical protein BSFA1_60220 [Burkholderia sp. SFA1]
MAGNHHPDACRIGVVFIEAQLTTLFAYASLLSDWIDRGAPPPDFTKAAPLLARKRSRPEAHTHSEDGTPMKPPPPEDALSWPSFDTADKRIAFALIVPCTNAILAVAEYFDIHRLSASRAPEVQFLMRLRDAAVNGNTFNLPANEYMPHAAYAGLIVEPALDGTLLFSDGVKPGFIEFGDTVGLLRYLTKLLTSMQSIISAGDAG